MKLSDDQEYELNMYLDTEVASFTIKDHTQKAISTELSYCDLEDIYTYDMYYLTPEDGMATECFTSIQLKESFIAAFLLHYNEKVKEQTYDEIFKMG